MDTCKINSAYVSVMHYVRGYLLFVVVVNNTFCCHYTHSSVWLVSHNDLAQIYTTHRNRVIPSTYRHCMILRYVPLNADKPGPAVSGERPGSLYYSSPPPPLHHRRLISHHLNMYRQMVITDGFLSLAKLCPHVRSRLQRQRVMWCKIECCRHTDDTRFTTPPPPQRRLLLLQRTALNNGRRRHVAGWMLLPHQEQSQLF